MVSERRTNRGTCSVCKIVEFGTVWQVSEARLHRLKMCAGIRGLRRPTLGCSFDPYIIFPISHVLTSVGTSALGLLLQRRPKGRTSNDRQQHHRTHSTDALHPPCQERQPLARIYTPYCSKHLCQSCSALPAIVPGTLHASDYTV